MIPSLGFFSAKASTRKIDRVPDSMQLAHTGIIINFIPGNAGEHPPIALVSADRGLTSLDVDQVYARYCWNPWCPCIPNAKHKARAIGRNEAIVVWSIPFAWEQSAAVDDSLHFQDVSVHKPYYVNSLSIVIT